MYTLAEGEQRETSWNQTSWNQQLHLVLPSSFNAEHPTLNLYFSQAEQDLNIAWRIDSAEFTPDLVSLIEGKNCFNCHDIFSQIGDQGRYTKSVATYKSGTKMCRIGILINVPDLFEESLKYRNLERRAKSQEVHLLYWKPNCKEDVDKYMELIQSWQASCRRGQPFEQHLKALMKWSFDITDITSSLLYPFNIWYKQLGCLSEMSFRKYRENHRLHYILIIITTSWYLIHMIMSFD